MPPEIPLKGLIDCFPDKLRGLVRLHNHVSAVAADMQLRVAAHIGPVEHDGYGFVGATDVNFAFRMLDARPLKNQLAKSGAELGLIVSDYVYNSLICRYPRPRGPRCLPDRQVPDQEHQDAGLDVPTRRGGLTRTGTVKYLEEKLGVKQVGWRDTITANSDR